ncbi:MAG: hypothetical protein KIT43_07300 [Bauldia sp.]|nr:hypothetical protein [Bauldia sp.]MCW5718355.1 hypothetical protein [Bauldia sp.]
MTQRSFFVLLLLTVVAFVAAVAAVWVQQAQSRPDPAGGEFVFPLLVERKADIAQVTLESRRWRVVLEKRGDEWFSIDRGDYPIREQPLIEALDAISGLTTLQAKTDNPDLYDDIGVGGPGPNTDSVHVRIAAADGTVLADGILGAVSRSIGVTPRGGLFVRRTDEAQSWLAEGTVYLPTYLTEWFDPLLSVPGTSIARVVIYSGDTMLFDAEKIDFATGDYELRYVDPVYEREGLVAEDNQIRGFAQAVVSTSFEDARARDSVAVPADARSVEFTTRDGLLLRVTLVPVDDATWVLYDASTVEGATPAGESQAATIRQNTADWAFLLPPSRIITLSRPVEQLITVPVQTRDPGVFTAPPPVFIPGLP